jgi:trehalose-6-phosphate synthase
VQAKSTKEWNDIFKIALKMEREQIENAFENGMNAVNIHNLEQYYNETYGGQDEK